MFIRGLPQQVGPVIGSSPVVGGTVGSVLFIGTGGVVQEDNTNLFWDDTNNRLGIGTAAPAVPLHVVGDVRATTFTTLNNNPFRGLNSTGTAQTLMLYDSSNDLYVGSGISAVINNLYFGSGSLGLQVSGSTGRVIFLTKLQYPSGNTQTTVGAAGAASALPAQPTGYLRMFIDATERVIPFYAQA